MPVNAVMVGMRFAYPNLLPDRIVTMPLVH